MCGIAGFINFNKSFSIENMQSVAARMAAALQHRGPDFQGVWSDPAVGIALSHQRLSIIDRSELGNQPMQSQNQRYVMVYNGEIYNFPILKKALKNEIFKGHSDSEVLLAAFSAWGVDETLKHINGMFAIALFDKVEQQLYLIRDRMGQKPLYYGKQGQHFFFASELKALAQHPNFQKQVDRKSLAAYVRLNYVPAPRSIYHDIFKVLPGHYVKLSLSEPGNLRDVCYWNHREIAELSQQQPFQGGYQEAVSDLEDLLKNAVSSRMISDVPLGAFLSGGIDSSLIVSLMQSQSSNPIKTFTIGFDEKHFNEAHEAKKVAQHLSTDHTELYVTPQQARDVIPKLASIYDEPFSDVSQIPTYLVSSLAKQDVTVALSGDGGDEFFAGYNRHFWVPMFWKRFGFLPAFLKAPFLNLFTLASPAAYNKIPGISNKNLGDKIYKLAGMLRHHSAADMYIDLISSWKDPNEVVASSVDPTLSQYQAFFKESSLDLLHQMMSLDARHYLPDDILVKVDRASMAVSLEARSPLLDHRIAEFAWRLPLNYKVQGQSGKRILKTILSNYLPMELIDRPKMGFGVPIGDWLRGPLKDWAQSLLDPVQLKQQGFFKSEAIVQKWQEHQSGARNWQYCLWNILMFQSSFEAMSSVSLPESEKVVSE